MYRTDGIFATAVERTGGDDGYHPFADGAYAVAGDGDALRVWYSSSFDYLAAPTATDGEPAFTLPTRTDRAFSCGLSAGTREPSPTPPPRPVYTADEARAGVAEMVAASLAATAGSARNATGAIIDAQELELVTTACGEDGTRVGVGIEFTTDDNAASLARILQVWDAAGYSPDRAMQEDIRYSGNPARREDEHPGLHDDRRPHPHGHLVPMQRAGVNRAVPLGDSPLGIRSAGGWTVLRTSDAGRRRYGVPATARLIGSIPVAGTSKESRPLRAGFLVPDCCAHGRGGSAPFPRNDADP